MQKNPDFSKSVIIVEKEKILQCLKEIGYDYSHYFGLFVVIAVVTAILGTYEYMPVSALLIALGCAICILGASIADSVSESPQQYNTNSWI